MRAPTGRLRTGTTAIEVGDAGVGFAGAALSRVWARVWCSFGFDGLPVCVWHGWWNS